MKRLFLTSALTAISLALPGCNSAAAPTASAPSVTLLPGGLAQGDTRIDFGADQSALAALLAGFGPTKQESNDECGAGPMTFMSSPSTGLTLNFQDGKFIGWFASSVKGKAATNGGIGVGSRRFDLEKAMPIEIQTDSTLGTEFFSPAPDDGFIGGFLTSDTSDATVESLYAGTNCFFR